MHLIKYLVLSVVLAAGCYSPSYKDCEVSCASGVCPSGLSCQAGMCRASGASGACMNPDGGGGSDSGTGDIPIDQLDTAQINALCMANVRCGMFEDQNSCVRAYSSFLHLNPSVIAAVNAGRVIYHPDKARACIDGIALVPCERSTFLTDRGDPPACRQTFEGTVGANGTCAMSEECISQSCNFGTCNMACCMGTCVGGTPPGTPSIGQACTPQSLCQNSYCEPSTMMCTAYKAVGTACNGNDQCAPGNYCSTISNPPVCKQLIAEGQTCNSTGDCRDLDDLCVSSGPLPPSCTKTGLTGSPCSPSTQSCQQLHTCVNGACAQEPGPGQHCTSSDTCVDGSYCDGSSQVCTTNKPDGATCPPGSSGIGCQSGYCDPTSTTCKPRPICI